MINSDTKSTKFSRFFKSGSKAKDKSARAPYKRIKQAIWLYFFLLLFEGALRRWVLPEFSTAILIIRDPIAVWLIATCFQKKILTLNWYLTMLLSIGFISFFTTIFQGHGNISVALYGLRVLILHFPLIFIIGRVFDHQDAVKMGKALLWISIPMTILMIVQFYSPQSDLVNRGLIGSSSEGGGFSGALGYFRPPATFSFITGLAQFYGLTGAFIFYFWLDDQIINRWLLVLTTACLLISIPFSISRVLFFSIAISFVFATFASLRTAKHSSRFVVAFLIGLMLFTILRNFDLFQTGVEAFTVRFETASFEEGGAQGIFFDRFLGGMLGAVLNAGNIPFWGYGLGMGTNAGAMLLTGSSDIFLISEGEWGRLIGEMGLFLGLAAILIRVSFAFKLMLRSIPAMIDKNFLPWLMVSFSFLNILQGQWAQPTSLGFAVLSGGLVLASLKKPKLIKNIKPQ